MNLMQEYMNNVVRYCLKGVKGYDFEIKLKDNELDEDTYEAICYDINQVRELFELITKEIEFNEVDKKIKWLVIAYINGIEVEVSYLYTQDIDEVIKRIETEYYNYYTMDNFNFKDFFNLLDIRRLKVDARTKQLFELYNFTISVPVTDINNLPYILLRCDKLFKFSLQAWVVQWVRKYFST